MPRVPHWNENVVVLMKSSSLAALKVVKMTTFSAASDENFIKMTTFPFQCIETTPNNPKQPQTTTNNHTKTRQNKTSLRNDWYTVYASPSHVKLSTEPPGRIARARQSHLRQFRWPHQGWWYGTNVMKYDITELDQEQTDQRRAHIRGFN